MSHYRHAQQAQELGPLFDHVGAASAASGRRPSPDANKEAKERGMDRAESRNPDLAEVLRDHARGVSNRLGSVSIDDVRAFVDANGLSVPSPAFWGTVFRGPGWECVGFELSKRPGKNAHRQPRWKWNG